MNDAYLKLSYEMTITSISITIITQTISYMSMTMSMTICVRVMLKQWRREGGAIWPPGASLGGGAGPA